MDSIKAKLAAFQESKAGQFLQKFQDDQGFNLASLLAWGTLSSILPLLLGVLGIAGLVLRDQQRLDQLYSTLLVMVPAQAAGPLGDALDGVRKGSAGGAGIVGLLLLLYNGGNFFSNMASVFNQAYHVENRNFLVHRLVAIFMLAVTAVLLVVSTVALGFGAVIGSLPLGLPFGPVFGRVISWSLSILSAILLFLLIYRILPNVKQGWRDVLPGALAASVLFFVITLMFPLYLQVFPPNQAYAAFGIFLVFTFWLYLLGIAFILGAELNAFLQNPARSVALAEATQRASHGKAAVEQQRGTVVAQATGDAPNAGARALDGDARSPQAEGGPTDSAQKGGKRSLLGGPVKSPHASGQSGVPAGAHAATTTKQGAGTSIAGKLLGFVALIVAAVLLRGRSLPANAAQPTPSEARAG